MLYSNNKFVYFTVQSLRHLHISAGEQATNSLLRLLAPLTSFIFIALGQPLPVPSAKAAPPQGKAGKIHRSKETKHKQSF